MRVKLLFSHRKRIILLWSNLGAAGGSGLQETGKRTIGVGTDDHVHLAGGQQGLLHSLSHASQDSHDHVGTLAALDVELLDTAEDALLRIVADRTGIFR